MAIKTEFVCFTYLVFSFAMMATTLHLCPLPISETGARGWIGPDYLEILKSTSLFFVEDIRTVRRFVSSLKAGISIDSIRFEVLNKDTTAQAIQAFGAMIENESAVVMSESGCPGIADPGSALVSEAHRRKIQVMPWVGPSSIFLALMGSGLSGQQFCFHGYLPVDADLRAQKIRQLEKESSQRHQTQIFIETPYRNQVLWNTLLKELKPDSKLAFARDISGSTEVIRQMPVSKWRQRAEIEWNKIPTVFLFLA